MEIGWQLEAGGEVGDTGQGGKVSIRPSRKGACLTLQNRKEGFGTTLQRTIGIASRNFWNKEHLSKIQRMKEIEHFMQLEEVARCCKTLPGPVWLGHNNPLP
ncbi:hypothetical protein CRENBAI_015907 [Crenichthys baileyi]|uniref:Uncharacterized protein n=1 Tax=Crenichthys baileyi TaxID=28760 RepID=A0AAV9QR28_9TELE